MTDNERMGGRMFMAAGLLIAFILLLGSGFEAGFNSAPSPGVGIAVAVVVGTFTAIAIGVGCYNLGRERGR